DSTGTAISASNGVYTISAAGEYTATGKLSEGQIYVSAGDDDTVQVNLDGVSISNSSTVPIFVNNCADFDLKAKADSNNYLYDNRTTDYSGSDDDSVARGAVYSVNGDINVKGSGALYVWSAYNSGIHGKDNVSVKNVTMVVKAMNNGIRGNDKVTIKEGPTMGIVCGNNGIVTHNSDISDSGNQRGYVYIQGGNIIINSYGDGIDAAYNIEFSTSTDDEGNTYTPVVDVYTNIYSTYTVSSSSLTSLNAGPGGGGPGGSGSGGTTGGGPGDGGMTGGTSAEKADDSAKAFKAANAINIAAGQLYSYTYDDGYHTDTDALENGSTGTGHITVNDGTLTIKASDDGMHAGGTLTIAGGTVYVEESHEGLEGNQIAIKGGNIVVYGNDDGINASNAITISGGFLEVNVPNSGDVDGIDSNGTYTQTGGVVVAKGPSSDMSAPIDCDGTKKITGGTLIILGYSVSVSSSVSKISGLSLHSSGSHTFKVGSTSYTINNNYSYSATTCYSNSSVSA
ncbi:MAG: carbohydrate-binding domain-containing protein, partial [Bacilli bacterium]|nr:carbohydrate-binding domain-containing protein [Bacilli bacterium]